MHGWITLHRKIEENELWLAEPFTRGQAWVDLLLIANHKPQLLYKRNIPITIERGQVGWSHDKLGKRWKWGRKKVVTFLKTLKREQQIILDNNHTLSRIIIVNYDKYQKRDNSRTTEGTTKDTNNNNVNNVNNKLSETSSLITNNKKEDMSWNKYSEDFEEGSINLDGDGTIKEEKKASKAKYPNAPTIRKIFQEVLGLNPLQWRTNTTELTACENLFTERTPEKVRSALEFFKENQDDKFCPSISQPSDLDRKWTKLGAYKLSKE